MRLTSNPQTYNVLREHHIASVTGIASQLQELSRRSATAGSHQRTSQLSSDSSPLSSDLAPVSAAAVLTAAVPALGTVVPVDAMPLPNAASLAPTAFVADWKPVTLPKLTAWKPITLPKLIVEGVAGADAAALPHATVEPNEDVKLAVFSPKAEPVPTPLPVFPPKAAGNELLEPNTKPLLLGVAPKPAKAADDPNPVTLSSPFLLSSGDTAAFATTTLAAVGEYCFGSPTTTAARFKEGDFPSTSPSARSADASSFRFVSVTSLSEALRARSCSTQRKISVRQQHAGENAAHATHHAKTRVCPHTLRVH